MEDSQTRLKETVRTWNAAVSAHTSGRYSDAVRCYGEISNISARMYYNMACAHAQLNDNDSALQCLTNAIEKDAHLVIAYFQRGSLYLLQNRVNESIQDLKKTKVLMRGNSFINYKPLGLLVRINSFQVLYNLAIACMYDGRITEAENVLKEARHDTDDTQKKTINSTLQCLNTGYFSDIKPILAPKERVFSPPKSITRNLIRKSLIEKARVVAAKDVKDLSTKFDGERRVEEIKQKAAMKSQKFPVFCIGRFLKNLKLRSDSDTIDKSQKMQIKTTKSMEDFRSISSEHISDGKQLDHKNILLFSKSHSMSMSNINEQGQGRQQQFDKTKEPGNHVAQHKRLRGVKKLLKSKSPSCEKYPVFDGVKPAIAMRGSYQSANLKLAGSDVTDRKSLTSLPDSTSPMYQNQSVPKATRRKSLGTVFGDNLSVVGRTLSMSCDVLTSMVTPLECECITCGQIISDTDSAISSSNEENSSARSNSSSPVFTFGNDVRRLSANSRSSSTSTSDIDELNTSRSDKMTQTGNDVTSGDIIRYSSSSEDSVVNVGEKKKPRPPPPSYPPPPLPVSD